MVNWNHDLFTFEKKFIHDVGFIVSCPTRVDNITEPRNVKLFMQVYSNLLHLHSRTVGSESLLSKRPFNKIVCDLSEQRMLCFD